MVKEKKMKNFTLVLISMLCLVFAACASDEDDVCVTAFDCPDGYSCIDSICRPASGDTGTSENGEDSSDSDLPLPGGDDSGDELPDNGSVPGENDGDAEISDENAVACPNGCSGFGTCDFETGKCTCKEYHQGEDCSECKEGYHLEAEGDDEDGNPDIRSCVVNQTCNPNPCNNSGCREEGDTVKCTCSTSTHSAGRWCEDCAEGYLKSNVDGTCKPDCSGMTCTAPQKCGVDYTANEAGCNVCDEYYSGTDCKSCDVAHFCGEHANSCVVENGTEKCGCESGFVPNNNKCVKECDAKRCFKEYSCSNLLGSTSTIEGHCNVSTCECDQGWLTNGLGESVMCSLTDVPDNVMCTVCDVDNPPANLSTPGCTETCPSGFCDDSILGLYGACYTEPVTHKLACQCTILGTMSGSKYYDENPTGMCE